MIGELDALMEQSFSPGCVGFTYGLRTRNAFEHTSFPSASSMTKTKRRRRLGAGSASIAPPYPGLGGTRPAIAAHRGGGKCGCCSYLSGCCTSSSSIPGEHLLLDEAAPSPHWFVGSVTLMPVVRSYTCCTHTHTAGRSQPSCSCPSPLAASAQSQGVAYQIHGAIDRAALHPYTQVRTP